MKSVARSLLGVWIAVLASTAWAQSNLGSILGNARDSTGAPIPGVSVSVRNQGTNFIRNATTDGQGFYFVDRLEPGIYTVSAKHPGMKQFERDNVRLDSNAQVRIEMPLVLGAIEERVVVTAASPVVETENGRIATTVDRLQEVNSALGQRSTYNFIMSSPAGYYNNASGYSSQGSRGTHTGFTMDGIAVGNQKGGTMNSEFYSDNDAVQELRLNTVNNSAEYASQAVVNQTSIAGTNQVHGLFEYRLYNEALDARPWFSTVRPLDRGNYYYGLISGPVYVPKVYDGRNKTFFSFFYNTSRTPNTPTTITNVPTDAMRSGDFSQLKAAIIKDPLTGLPFSDNKIPANRISPSALKYLDRFYLKANAGGPSSTANNLNVPYLLSVVPNLYIGRIDQNIGSKDVISYKLFARFTDFHNADNNLPAEVLGYLVRLRTSYQHVLSSTHTFSPTMVNEVRAGFVRQDFLNGSALQGKSIVDLVGLTGYPGPVSSTSTGIPAVSITGLLGINVRQAGHDRDNWWDVYDTLSINRGAHAIKTGVNVFHHLTSSFPLSPSTQFGTFAFDGFATGQPFGDFLLGIPHTANYSAEISPFYARRNTFAAFFQDDWKVLPNLTLNLGIRWEFALPFTEENNRIFNFDPTTGDVVVPNTAALGLIHPLFPKNVPVATAASVGFPISSLIRNDLDNFAPRFGFAWRSGLAGIIVRGGYSIFYNSEAHRAIASQAAGPYVATQTYDNVISPGGPLFAWPQAFPAAGPRALSTQDVNGISVSMPESYDQQWNFTLERQFGENGLRLSYVGSNSMHLPYIRNLNQPYPSTKPFDQNSRPYPYLRNINFADAGGTASFNSLQVQFMRRLAKDIAIDSHYTWAKDLTDVRDVNSGLGDTILNAYDRRSERGNVEYAPRHRWDTQVLWQVPFGKGRRYMTNAPPVVDAVLGGWSMSHLVVFGTGEFNTPTYSGRDTTGTNVTAGRPDRVCDGRLSNPTIQRWFDTSCFVIPVANSGRFGNSSNGVIEGPPQSGWSMRLFKTFTIYERARLTVDGLFDNVLNHFIFGPPNVNISSSSVGTITTGPGVNLSGIVDASRFIRLGARLEF